MDPVEAAGCAGTGDATADADCHNEDTAAMAARAEAAAQFLKALSHEGRLMILCHLGSGEKSVTELETLLGSRQAAVSQQLARLRIEGLVTCRREGKTVYYAIGDGRVRKAVGLMYDLFCRPDLQGGPADR